MADYLVWECMICGFIYDEAQGWPDDGIAPGTRWADVPDDWLCPDCGVGKEDFDMVPIAQSSADTAAASTSVPDVPPAPQAIASQAGKPSGHWHCDLCGWTYLDDAQAPFQQLPADWRCPGCGAPKTAMTPKPAADAPLVILGTGLAGYNLAREWRKLDPHTPLLLITQDDGTFYSKPLISTGFAKGMGPDQMATASAADMAEQLNAQIITHTRVIGLDWRTKTLQLTDQTIGYGQLVLAQGSAAFTPPLTGTGTGQVLTVNDLTDYRKFHAALAGKRKVLIVGAGLIGSEYANDLIQANYEVAVVDLLPSPLGGLLPEPVGRAVQHALTARGVRYHLGTSVQHLDTDGTGVCAQLANGTQIHADLVLSAIGVKPRTQLAQSAGLAVGRGIKTDALLRAYLDHPANCDRAVPDQPAEAIYALGDCAEVAGQSLLYVMPLMHAARALAKTLAGQPTQVRYPAMPVVVKTTLCPTVVSPVPQGQVGRWEVASDSPSDVQALFYDAQGRLRGFALCGRYLREKDALTRQLPAILE